MKVNKTCEISGRLHVTSNFVKHVQVIYYSYRCKKYWVLEIPNTISPKSIWKSI